MNIFADSPHILIATGYPNYQRKVELVNVDEKVNCTKSLEFPITVSSASGGMIGGIPTICGGTDLQKCYQLKNGQWEQPFSLHSSRRDAASLVIYGSLIITGGISGNETLASTEIITNPDSVKSGGSLNAPLSHHCMVLFKGEIFVIGGRLADKTERRTTDIYDIYDNSLNYNRQGPDLNIARRNIACTNFQGKIVLVPSYSDTSKEIEVYDPDIEKWSLSKLSILNICFLTIVSVSGSLHSFSNHKYA